MRVNEIFYSLQGEGLHAGEAAVFVRFSGCNLRCPFCDTQHESGSDMSEDEIVVEVTRYPARMVVVTGGEPSLQLTATLVDMLHKAGKYIAVETNGTHPLPPNVDWITLSPKGIYVDGAEVVLKHVDEVKILFDGIHDPDRQLSTFHFPLPTSLCHQPMDIGDARRNSEIAAATVDYIKHHPQWRLSLQQHKILNIR